MGVCVTVDYRQLYPKIQQLAERVEQSSFGQRERCQKALEAFNRFSEEIDFLEARVAKAIALQGKTLRCASPFEAPLSTTCPLPALRQQVNLAAADGSQILPDRHAELFFGLINVGGVTLPLASQSSPQEYSQSEFWYTAEVEEFNEAVFNFRRDVLERKLLFEISSNLEPPILALTDGPLELWMEYRTADEERQELKRLLQSYLNTLESFRQRGFLFCGYVDRPESAYVVRLLELAIATDQDWGDVRRWRPFKGVMDADLFGNLLRPGERSAIFALQSPLLEHLSEEDAVCFFYLHVGNEMNADLARVELPRWVARQRPLVDLLHATLISQCRHSGVFAYPYLLHRAHEVAVVHPQDRETILRSLLVELQRRGLPPSYLSRKQALKNLPSRKPSRLD